MTIVHSDSVVTLVGSAPADPSDLTMALSHGERLVAADGGAGVALAAGRMPEAVIGDMDSLSSSAAARLSGRLHRIGEQESTDFDKALRNIAAPLTLAVGFTGGRFDHELAVMNTLVRRPDRRCVVIGAQSLVCLIPPRLDLDLAAGTTVSLFPMAPVGCTGTGLRWPIDHLSFAPDGRVGTSNIAEGPVRLDPAAPKLLLILPRACLAALVAALTDPPPTAPARWPAPAG